MKVSKTGYETAFGEDFPLEKMLSELDFLVRGPALESALRAASKLVSDAAAKRISRSTATGTSQKKSKQQKTRDLARLPLADSIGVKVIRKNDGAVFIAVTGQKLNQDQKGGRKRFAVAHSHLLEFGHKAHYWSKKPATRKTFVEAKRWLAPAVDTTREQQRAIIIDKLSKSIRRHHKMKGGK